MSPELPVFAVVGHPNKGKSSLVSTLARDLSVGVGPDPGTTRRARAFPMRVEGRTLYTLVDTPGFQRARAALSWMRANEADAASRPAVVARFLRIHADADLFHDEVELLRPIVEGAGIIYVVDGATPYGPEYEAEMEILRWTGRPSMAIINPIGEPRHVDTWRDALGQFFRIVRVVDVLLAPFEQQLGLLRAFGQLREDWQVPLEEAAEALLAQRQSQRRDAARLIAEMIAAALSYQETRDLGSDIPTAGPARELEERYRNNLRRIERQARTQVEWLYGYKDLDREETDFELLEADLLASETWLVFGLKRRDLIALGAVGGAVTGGMVDASLLGSSFFAGTLLGGLAGGAAGYLSASKLAEVKVLHQPLGGRRLRCGPTRNVQFPFVLLGRARLHHALLEARTHAQRKALVLERREGLPLPDRSKKALAEHFARIRKSRPGEERYTRGLEDLSDEITALLTERTA
jgi:hypothetical protein